MKTTVKSVTNPYAREYMAAEFLLKMIEKYGQNIDISADLNPQPTTPEEEPSEVEWEEDER
jgi:hypothetical protein